MDTAVPQSVMVTFDLASVGYYNQLALFNVLNGSVNRGLLGRTYQVTPDGFSIRSIDSGRLFCSRYLKQSKASKFGYLKGLKFEA